MGNHRKVSYKHKLTKSKKSALYDWCILILKELENVVILLLYYESVGQRNSPPISETISIATDIHLDRNAVLS